MTQWTNPTTQTDGKIIRTEYFQETWDDLSYIAIPPASFLQNTGDDNAAALTTASASFADIDSVLYRGSITTQGEPILVCATMFTTHSVGGSTITLDVTVDGTSISGGVGVMQQIQRLAQPAWPFTIILTGVGAGSHAIVIQWKTSAATASLIPTYHYGFGLRAI